MDIYNVKKLEQNGNEIILLLIVYETKVWNIETIN